mmetsp:Transcript_76918/g.222332  ORF Transcript_76918/g.222332 Transcript_76918/m.222332 type:complete len:247 (+) Transcript_76918:989-1729(+)
MEHGGRLPRRGVVDGVAVHKGRQQGGARLGLGLYRGGGLRRRREAVPRLRVLQGRPPGLHDELAVGQRHSHRSAGRRGQAELVLKQGIANAPETLPDLPPDVFVEKAGLHDVQRADELAAIDVIRAVAVDHLEGLGRFVGVELPIRRRMPDELRHRNRQRAVQVHSVERGVQIAMLFDDAIADVLQEHAGRHGGERGGDLVHGDLARVAAMRIAQCLEDRAVLLVLRDANAGQHLAEVLLRQQLPA